MQTHNQTYNHPIPEKYVHGSGPVSENDVHEFLEAAAEHIDTGGIELLSKDAPYENYYENDNVCAAFSDGMWEEIWQAIGLTFESDDYTVEYVDHALTAMMRAHQRFGVNELGMDHQQPMNILVASKDE